MDSIRRVVSLALSLAALASVAAAVGDGPTMARTGVVVQIQLTRSDQFGLLENSIDVWSHQPDSKTGKVDAWVSWEQLEALRAAGLQVELDPARTVALASLGLPLPGQISAVPGFPCYRTVEETFGALQTLAADHPDLATWTTLGPTWEKINNPPTGGFQIGALVITNANAPGPKAPFVLMAAIHAREMATAELATRFAEMLVEGYGVDPDITWILDHTVIHVIPHANPDGRKQAETGQLWRKNTNGTACSPTSSNRGIDLNRNSTYFWGPPSSSGSPCDATYRGPSAVSEPETQAVQDYLATVFEDQRGPGNSDVAPADTEGVFITLHSFSELVLFPWGGGGVGASPNAAELATLGRKFGYHNHYEVCRPGDCLYEANGTTDDYSYGVFGVASYTFEIGITFFESCTNFENTVRPNNLPALFYAAKAARLPYLEPKGPEAVGLALSAVSVIQGTLPTLTGTVADNRYDSGGWGTEPSQAVTTASYTVDAAPWVAVESFPLAAQDGAFDETVEAVTGAIDTATLSLGRHLLYVYGEDAAGNRGVPTAIFLEVTENTAIFSDGFNSGDFVAWSATDP